MPLKIKLPLDPMKQTFSCPNCTYTTKFKSLLEEHGKDCDRMEVPNVNGDLQNGDVGLNGDEVTAQNGDENISNDSEGAEDNGDELVDHKVVVRHYTCKSCGYQTTNSKSFLFHQRDEHKADFDIYLCDICDYASKWKCKVVRHREMIHRSAPPTQDYQKLKSPHRIMGKPGPRKTPLSMVPTPEHPMRSIKKLADEFDFNDNMPLAQFNGSSFFGSKKKKGKKRKLGQEETEPAKKRVTDGRSQPRGNFLQYVDICSAEGQEPRYKCKLCFYSNLRKWQIRQHVKARHVNAKSYKCAIGDCEFSTYKKAEFFAHKTKHNQMTYECKECEYVTFLKPNLDRHKLNHGMVSVPFKCSLCSYASAKEAAVMRHVQEHHSAKDKQVVLVETDQREADVQLKNGIESVDIPAAVAFDGTGSHYQPEKMPSSLDAIYAKFRDMVDGQSTISSGTCDTEQYYDRYQESPSVISGDYNDLSHSEGGLNDLNNDAIGDTAFMCPMCGFAANSVEKLNSHMESHGYDAEGNQVEEDEPKEPLRTSQCQDETVAYGAKDVGLTDTNLEQINEPPKYPEFDKPSNHADAPKYRVYDTPSRSLGYDEAPQSLTYDEGKDVIYEQQHIGVNFANSNPMEDDERKSENLSEEQMQGDGPSAEQNALVSSNGDVVCSICGYVAVTMTRLKGHMVSHSNDYKYNCELCPRKYKRSSDLNYHMKKAHNIRLRDYLQGSKEQDEPLNLSMRSNASNDSSSMGPEPLDFIEDGPLPDDSDVGEQPLDLSRHELMEESYSESIEEEELQGPDMQCSLCPYIAKWPSDMRRHLLVHSVDRRYRCHLCERSYKWQGDLNVHLKKYHVQKIESTTPPPMLKTFPTPSKGRKGIAGEYKCRYCDYVAKYTSELMRHTRIHTNEKPYRCLFCQYDTAWKGDLKRHIEKHHPDRLTDEKAIYNLLSDIEKEITENYCADYLPQDSDVTSVMSEENEPLASSTPQKGELPFNGMNGNDAIVGYPSDDRKGLPESDDPCLCKICGWRAPMPSKLQMHLVAHDNIKVYKCTLCGFRTNWVWDTRKHVRAKHGVADPGPYCLKMTEHDARATIASYMEQREKPMESLLSRNNNNCDKIQEKEMSPKPIQEMKVDKNTNLKGGPSHHGYARPFKCSSCPRRSNWKWELKKHIKLVHEGLAEIIVLSREEALATLPAGITPGMKLNIGDGMKTSTEKLKPTILKTPSVASVTALFRQSPPKVIPPQTPSPAKSILSKASTPSPSVSSKGSNQVDHDKSKKFKCSSCPYRSNYRSDVHRHVHNKHRKVGEVLILDKDVARATLQEYLDTFPGKKFMGRSKRRKLEMEALENQEKLRNAAEFKESERKKWKCKKCDFQHFEHDAIVKHISEHAEHLVMAYSCKICPYMANSLNAIRRHIRSIHEIVDQDTWFQNEIEENGIISGSIKNGDVNEPYKLDEDRMEESEVPVGEGFVEKRFRCKQCGARSNWKNAMYRHIREVHSLTSYSLIEELTQGPDGLIVIPHVPRGEAALPKSMEALNDVSHESLPGPSSFDKSVDSDMHVMNKGCHESSQSIDISEEEQMQTDGVPEKTKAGPRDSNGAMESVEGQNGSGDKPSELEDGSGEVPDDIEAEPTDSNGGKKTGERQNSSGDKLSEPKDRSGASNGMPSQPGGSQGGAGAGGDGGQDPNGRKKGKGGKTDDPAKKKKKKKYKKKKDKEAKMKDKEEKKKDKKLKKAKKGLKQTSLFDSFASDKSATDDKSALGDKSAIGDKSSQSEAKVEKEKSEFEKQSFKNLTPKMEPVTNTGILREGKYYVCNICPFKSVHANYIPIHQRLHVKQPGNEHKCPHCPYYVAFPHLLKQHQKHHEKHPAGQELKVLKKKKKKDLSKSLDVKSGGKKKLPKSVRKEAKKAAKKAKVLHIEVVKPGTSTGAEEVVKVEIEKPVGRGRGQESRKLKEASKTAETTADVEEEIDVVGVTDSEPDKLVKGKGGASDGTFMSEFNRKFHDCPQCPYFSRSKMDMLYHMQFHRKRPMIKYKCQYCSYSAMHKRLITQHQKLHDPTWRVNRLETIRLLIKKEKTTDKKAVLPPSVHCSPAKSEVSERSYADYDPVDIASIKHDLIMSKILPVPISTLPEEKEEKEDGEDDMEEKEEEEVLAQKLEDSPQKDLGDQPKEADGMETEVTGELEATSEPATLENGDEPSIKPKKKRVIPVKKLHRCHHCPYTNIRGTNLRLHEKMHGLREGESLMKCPMCDYHVGNKGLLSHHLKVHAPNYQPEFTEPEIFEDKEADDKTFDNMLLPVDSNEPFQPKEDGVPFVVKYNDLLAKHTVHPTQYKKYSCEKCPYGTSKRSQYEKHYLLHGSKQKFTCEFCDYSVPLNSLLVQHKKLHLMPNQNLLAVQSISNLRHLPDLPADVAVAMVADPEVIPKDPIAQYSGMHDHLELFENGMEYEEPKKLYRCDRCPFTNVRRDFLLTHLKCHMIRSSLQCPYCDYSATNSELLDQHVKVHFGPLTVEEEIIFRGENRPKQEPIGLDLSVKGKWGLLKPDKPSDSNTEKLVVPKQPTETEKLPFPVPRDFEERTHLTDPKDDLTISAWTCRYCDRMFPTSSFLIKHEMQHLIGNHF